jgi:hypothetical protein
VRSAAVHPVVTPVVLLLAALALATCAALGLGGWRVIRGPGRATAAGWLVVGLVPAAGVYAPAERARRGWAHRDAPVDAVNRIVAFGGVALMEADARLRYPHRVDTRRLVMFHRGVATPQADADEMEQHVAAIEAELGRPLRAKVFWVRGRVLGQGGLSAFGLALGSDHSDPPGDDAGAAHRTDRHELAHAVLNQHEAPGADAPSFLNEGWAECHSDAPRQRVLQGRRLEALGRRGRGEWVSLEDLAGPRWYHQHSGVVYFQGHLWVEFILRRFGTDRFIDMCNTCRPATFDADCRRVYGHTPEELEAMFWEDVEAHTSAPGGPR